MPSAPSSWSLAPGAADWLTLHHSAVALAEAPNLLIMEGRKAAASCAGGLLEPAGSEMEAGGFQIVLAEGSTTDFMMSWILAAATGPTAADGAVLLQPARLARSAVKMRLDRRI